LAGLHHAGSALSLHVLPISLRTRLYIPEAFSVNQRDAINPRRVAQWPQAIAAPGKPQHLMLLIAEVKKIVPARDGFKAVVKHVPDQAFALDEQLYRRLGRRFKSALALWGAADDIRMVMIALASATLTDCDAPSKTQRSLDVRRHASPELARLQRGSGSRDSGQSDSSRSAGRWKPCPALNVLP